jgi:hypothetical protein
VGGLKGHEEIRLLVEHHRHVQAVVVAE